MLDEAGKLLGASTYSSAIHRKLEQSLINQAFGLQAVVDSVQPFGRERTAPKLEASPA